VAVDVTIAAPDAANALAIDDSVRLVPPRFPTVVFRNDLEGDAGLLGLIGGEHPAQGSGAVEGGDEDRELHVIYSDIGTCLPCEKIVRLDTGGRLREDPVHGDRYVVCSRSGSGRDGHRNILICWERRIRCRNTEIRTGRHGGVIEHCLSAPDDEHIT